MALIDEKLVEELITELGSDAVLKVIDTQTFDKFGEETVVYLTDKAIKVMVNSIGAENEFVKAGLYLPDDKIFLLDGTVNVSRGDIIVHNSDEYKIGDIKEAELENFVHVRELFTKRTINN